MINDKMLEASNKSQEHDKDPTITTSIQHALKVLACAVRQEKEMQRIRIEKEEAKILSCTNYKIIYAKSPTEPTNSLIQLTKS